MCSTVAGPFSCHQPFKPESFREEFSASHRANRTLIDIKRGGSPTAERNISETYFITKTLELLDESTPAGFFSFLMMFTRKSCGMSFDAGGL